ncbi:glycosyltransferase [Tessaracoccus massiliensis]|uniref:glycosyltransferase n=1 Tax=Tessaracoccus massiliensis TaxID=1522311 RepID=UPI000590D6F8|nr:glycosyltransferase [Tessaracoccus massiliensis]
MSETTTGKKIGYVLKVYPRFSETFIVTELISREAQGEKAEIFALRPTTDERFHPMLGRVQAPVTHSRKPGKLEEGWQRIAEATAEVPGFADAFAKLLPVLTTLPSSDVAQAVELATWATRRGITHLHAHFASLAGQSVAIAGRLTGIPYSVTTHAKDIFHESVNHEVLRFIIEGAHHVVTISAYNHRFLGELFPDLKGRLRQVNNGLDLTRFPYSDPEPVHSPIRIVSVGRLVEKKGFDLLVEAAACLRDEGIDVDVRIAGGGELTEQLQTQIDQLGLGGPSTCPDPPSQGQAQGSSVTLLGPRSQEEIVELLGWADVFAAPCRIGADGNADGLPTVLLEAMAVGLPVVAGDVTGIGEAVRNKGPRTGFLIPPDDVPTLVDALKAATSPTLDRAALARNARAVVESDYDSLRQVARLKEAIA